MPDSYLTSKRRKRRSFVATTKRPPRAKDITGLRRGSLVAVNYAGYRPYALKSRPNKLHKLSMWRCVCDCGNFTLVDLGRFMQGTRITCGCVRTTQHKTHGESSNGKPSTEYNTWRGIVERCTNPKCAAFDDYGGRGITVCAGWREQFQNFKKDVGQKPSKHHSLDRVNNDGGYWCGHCPECKSLNHSKNWRWATPKEQRYNQRICKPCLARLRSMSIDDLLTLLNETD